MMKKTLEQKIAHATTRVQHHVDKNSVWGNKMITRKNEYEVARTRTQLHSDKAEIWNEELTQLLAIKKLKELSKDEAPRIHDVIEIQRETKDVYINGILCKSVFDIEFEKDVPYGCFGHVGSDLLTTVTITFKVPDVTIK